MRADSDEHLVRYLLGELSEAETEALDEHSITDDALALRLREIENDLVDRYARGGPPDAALERLQRLSQASPYLFEKVRFAQALHALTGKSDSAYRPRRAWMTNPAAWWGLASAAVILLAVAAALVVRNTQLRNELVYVEGQRAAIDQQNARLQQELDRSRAASPARQPPVVPTFVLSAPRRSVATDPTTVSIPKGTELVSLRLPVESGEHDVLWAAVKDLSANRIVWRSEDLHSPARDGDRMVTVTIPVRSLTAQRYSVELAGVSRSGSSEVLTNYVIRVVLE
jgi:hypothetical protein